MVALCQPHNSFKPTTNKKFQVRILEFCQKKLRKVAKHDNSLCNAVEEILRDLKSNPYIGHKLHVNFDGCRSIPFLKNKYRIVYQVFEDKKEVLILQIGHRKDCYSELAKVLRRGF